MPRFELCVEVHVWFVRMAKEIMEWKPEHRGCSDLVELLEERERDGEEGLCVCVC